MSVNIDFLSMQMHCAVCRLNERFLSGKSIWIEFYFYRTSLLGDVINVLTRVHNTSIVRVRCGEPTMALTDCG